MPIETFRGAGAVAGATAAGAADKTTGVSGGDGGAAATVMLGSGLAGRSSGCGTVGRAARTTGAVRGATRGNGAGGGSVGASPGSSET